MNKNEILEEIHKYREEYAKFFNFCRVHQATLATRNIRDFLDCGIDLVNPWEAKR